MSYAHFGVIPFQNIKVHQDTKLFDCLVELEAHAHGRIVAFSIENAAELVRNGRHKGHAAEVLERHSKRTLCEYSESKNGECLT